MQGPRKQSLYDVLKIARDSSLDEIKAAFKRTALQVHPDKGGSKEAFQQVYQAFHVLTNAESRTKYDRKISVSPGEVGKEQRARRSTQKDQSTSPKATSPEKSTDPKPAKCPDEALLKQIRACLQKLSREDRFKVISEEFSQRQRLLFEKWMELPEVQQTQAAGRPQKRRKVPVAVSEEVIRSPEERPLALGDQCQAKGRGRAKVRGIGSRHKGNKIFYFAALGFNNFMIRTRNSDLPTALEYLVLLTAWTQRCKACGALNSEELQQALEASAKEHNVRVEVMGLKFLAEMSQNFWFGQGNKVTSPVVRSLPEICHINDIFNRFRSHFIGRGRRPVYLAKQSPVHLQECFEMFQVLYAEIWSKAGMSKDQSLARVRRLYDSSQPERDKRIQLLAGFKYVICG